MLLARNKKLLRFVNNTSRPITSAMIIPSCIKLPSYSAEQLGGIKREARADPAMSSWMEDQLAKFVAEAQKKKKKKPRKNKTKKPLQSPETKAVDNNDSTSGNESGESEDSPTGHRQLRDRSAMKAAKEAKQAKIKEQAELAAKAKEEKKKQRSKALRAQKRSEAYSNLQAAMPSLFGRASSPEQLRAAIELAKEAGVSLVEIRDAEEALAKLEAKAKR